MTTTIPSLDDHHRSVLLQPQQRSTRRMSTTQLQQAPSSSSSSSSSSASSVATTTTTTVSTKEYMVLQPGAATDEWEIDCFSRPVILEDGKKLWDVLITDSVGSFRFRQVLFSNQVNSKTVRGVVDDLIETVELKPNTIRFFRGAMFNMIQIALSELPVTSKPSRCTFALASWLEELYRNTYPNMNGYNPNMVSSTATPSFLDIRTPIKLPDALRGEKYAFVALPIQEFLPGGTVTTSNIGVGRLCPIPNSFFPSSSSSGNDDEDAIGSVDSGLLIGADTFVQGVVILSSRAPALAAWLAGTEVVALQADLRKRILTMETDIDNQYLMAKLNDQQRAEAVAFEEGKDTLQGLHFISVQKTEDDDPEGFWLLRELPTGI
jgi:RNA-binding protein Tab2/Atab2